MAVQNRTQTYFSTTYASDCIGIGQYFYGLSVVIDGLLPSHSFVAILVIN